MLPELPPVEQPVDYFAPPERIFTLARFGGPKETREAFQAHPGLEGGAILEGAKSK